MYFHFSCASSAGAGLGVVKFEEGGPRLPVCKPNSGVFNFAVRKMNIHFSRHARRRARLYKIEENDVKKIIRDENLVQGMNEVVRSIPGLIYTVKIVGVAE